MKKLLIIAAMIGFGISANAQTPKAVPLSNGGGSKTIPFSKTAVQPAKSRLSDRHGNEQTRGQRKHPLRKQSELRSTSTVWYEPDTIVVYEKNEGIDGIYRYSYSYLNGYITQELLQEQNSGAWVNGYKKIYTYDAQSNMTEYWDWDNGEWVNYLRDVYIYDAQGNREERLVQRWDNGIWVNDYKYSYTYDAQGNETEELVQRWDNGIWVNDYKYSYTYDAQGNETEYLYQSWNVDDEWGNITKLTYTYDVQGNRIEYLFQSWDNDAWENVNKSTYIYNVQDNMTGELYQQWDGIAWVNEWKSIYTYDVQGNMTEELGQDWDNDAWIDGWKIVRIYDAQSNMTEELWQEWRNDAWVNIEEYTYTYDAQGNSIASSHRGFEAEDDDAMLYMYYNNMQSEDLTFWGYKYTASYINVNRPVGIESVGVEDTAVKVYPNPVTNGELRIESGELKEGEVIAIYNLGGVQVAAYQTAGSQTTINISHLPSGAYLVKVKNLSELIIKN